jgi:hypothetical protein
MSIYHSQRTTRVFLLTADETELSTTSTSYTSMKYFNFVMDRTRGYSWNKLVVYAEAYNNTSGQTTYVGVFVDNETSPRLELTYTTTSYTLKSGEITVSNLSDGIHKIDIRVKVTGGTGYIRLVEVHALI